VRSLILRLIPKAFLENYHFIIDIIKDRQFPSSPKLIYTANAHFHNVIFLAYTAEKIEQGSKLIIADHGSNGCYAFSGAYNYQHTIADISLSWGWSDKDHTNIKPFGILKTVKINKWDRRGIGLIVENIMPRYSSDVRSILIGEQWINYLEDQFTFYSLLNNEIKNNMLVRLYPADFGWQQKKRWQDKFNDVKLDNGKLPIEKLINKSRLIISTWNGTTYLESLSQNIPTILFWNPNYWELHGRAVSYFRALEEVGIFHKLPESAALKVNKVWNSVSEWWGEKKVQKVRQEFCDYFAKKNDNMIIELKKFFISISN